MRSKSTSASRSESVVCPLCEASRLRPSGRDSMGCESCGGDLSGAMLETLRRISALPDALGAHACEECGHPEMRRLPDETFHCPACGSEVLPIDAPSTPSKSGENGLAYWAGWADGSFVDRGQLRG
jgi:ribosomal protein L37AE/L43A